MIEKEKVKVGRSDPQPPNLGGSNFAFDKTNFILLAIGMAVVIVGLLLMTGPATSDSAYEPDIFSARRIKVAPLVCLVGFVSMIYAVIRKPKS
jgi:hypothetical protein